MIGSERMILMTVRIEQSQMEEIEKIVSERSNWSKADVVRDALQKYVSNYNRMIKESNQHLKNRR